MCIYYAQDLSVQCNTMSNFNLFDKSLSFARASKLEVSQSNRWIWRNLTNHFDQTIFDHRPHVDHTALPLRGRRQRSGGRRRMCQRWWELFVGCAATTCQSATSRGLWDVEVD